MRPNAELFSGNNHDADIKTEFFHFRAADLLLSILVLTPDFFDFLLLLLIFWFLELKLAIQKTVTQ
jgi:hypothetical protein